MAKEFVRVGRLSLIKSRPHDAEFIADDLRLHDLRECLIHGLQPLEALTEPFAVDGAHTYTLMLDETPIGMCGTVPIEDSGAKYGYSALTELQITFVPSCVVAQKLLHSYRMDMNT